MQSITIILENLPAMVLAFCTALALPAFMVSVIVQATKEIGPLKNLPTDLLLLAVSLLVTLFAYSALVYFEILLFNWFFTLATIMCSFFVAFVAKSGWQEVKNIWIRFYDGKNAENSNTKI